MSAINLHEAIMRSRLFISMKSWRWINNSISTFGLPPLLFSQQLFSVSKWSIKMKHRGIKILRQIFIQQRSVVKHGGLFPSSQLWTSDTQSKDLIHNFFSSPTTQIHHCYTPFPSLCSLSVHAFMWCRISLSCFTVQWAPQNTTSRNRVCCIFCHQLAPLMIYDPPHTHTPHPPISMHGLCSYQLLLVQLKSSRDGGRGGMLHCCHQGRPNG